MPIDREEILQLVKEEGNRHDFINAKSGYECIIARNPTTGAWCGFVVLPKNHPFYKLHHDTVKGLEGVDIKVHGGLTFSQNGVFGFDCSHYGDYYPLGYSHMNVMETFITQFVESYERAGVDKNAVYRDKEWVIKETHSMAEQFFSYKDIQLKNAT